MDGMGSSSPMAPPVVVDHSHHNHSAHAGASGTAAAAAAMDHAMSEVVRFADGRYKYAHGGFSGHILPGSLFLVRLLPLAAATMSLHAAHFPSARTIALPTHHHRHPSDCRLPPAHSSGACGGR